MNQKPYQPYPFLEACYNELYGEATNPDTFNQLSSASDYLEEFSTNSEASNRYEIKDLVGEGAVKQVFNCYDRATRRHVAYATAKEGFESIHIDSIIHEAWLTSSLAHPNIINVHDTGVNSSRVPYFTMELKNNTTLKDRVEQRCELQQLLEIFQKISLAIAYAHSQNIIHLDLKPENIQCGEYGEVLVCDWGLGKSIDDWGILKPSYKSQSFEHLAESELMTLHGQIRGSLGYMAPEQVHGLVEKDHRTDIFSLGAILYFILTGQAPFTGTKEEVLSKTKSATVTFPLTGLTRQKIPKSLSAIALKAMQPQSNDRYQSVEELHQDIQNFLAGYPVNAEPPSMVKATKLFLRRNQSMMRIAFASIATICLFTGIYLNSAKNLKRVFKSEKERAEGLSSAVLHLNSENKRLEKAVSSTPNDLLRKHLIEGDRRLKEHYIKDPLIELEFAQAELEKACALHPDSPNANTRLCLIYSIKMDFHSAAECQLKDWYEPDTKWANFNLIKDQYRFAQKFRSLPFAIEQRRPTIDEFVDFINQARKAHPGRGDLLAQMIRYDFHIRKNKEDFPLVLVAYLLYLNENNSGFQAEYRFDDRTLVIASVDADKEVLLRHNLPNTHSRMRQSLSYLDVNSLAIRTPARINLRALNKARIVHLDLSATEHFEFEEQTIIRGLNRITIQTSAQDSISERFRKLNKSVSFHVIE